MSTRKIRSSDESHPYLERVHSHRLPGEVIPLVETYNETMGDRETFLWKWAHYLFEKFTLSCVPRPKINQLQTNKLIGLMFVSVLDDIAEKHADRATFEEAAKIPFSHQSVNFDRNRVDQEVLLFASTLWEGFSAALADAPRSTEFEDIIRFDLKQVLNAIDYSLVGNQNIESLNGKELRAYDAHNMMLFIFADQDIVHSPEFDKTELSTLRRVLGRAQQMVRIGNWMTTWERELSESDFTSGIVVYALENDIVSIDELSRLRTGTNREEIDRVTSLIREYDVEATFLRQWQEELTAARKFTNDITSVDIDEYLDGIESIMDYHLASRGLK